MEQEWYVVAAEIQVPPVGFGDPRQIIEVLDVAALRVVLDLAVDAVADAGDLGERLAICKIDDLMIELAAHHKVDGARGIQALVRLDGHRRSDEADLQLRITVLHHLGHLYIDVKAGSRGKENEQFEFIGHRHRLLDGNLVRRSVDYFRVGQHSGGIAEPYRIPIGFNLTSGRPPGTCAAVKTFKRRRVKKERSHAPPLSLPGRHAHYMQGLYASIRLWFSASER